MTTIRIAHSRFKGGFSCYSYEETVSPWHGKQKSGHHVISRETLEEARAEIEQTIRQEWRLAGRELPEIVECGKVSHLRGVHGAF